jgi:hypothetical protein
MGESGYGGRKNSMAHKPKSAKRGTAKPAKRKAAAKKKEDALDAFIMAATAVLGLPVEKSWLPAIKANLHVTLQHADAVVAFDLPDEPQPAPVFKA